MARNPEKQKKLNQRAVRSSSERLAGEINATRDRKLNKGQFSPSPLRRMAASADAGAYTQSWKNLGGNMRRAGVTGADVERTALASRNANQFREKLRRQTQERLAARGEALGAPARSGGEKGKRNFPQEGRAGASVQGEAGLPGRARWDSHQKRSRSEAAKAAWATRRRNAGKA